MPSFLTKVFGRKKDEKEPPPRTEGRASDASLLGGKFETLSPSAIKFPEVPNGKGQVKEKDKDIGFTLFKVKSRQVYPEIPEKRVEAPKLSLRLPSQRAVFEPESEDQKSLTDSVLGDRRLNPVETLTLIRACSQAITARGLETLGVMHPHWYSASPDIQRRLISLFIQSLAPKSPISTLSPTASPFESAFESEISSARSPHDVAAVLRWGLRHLRLENGAFCNDDAWYNKFCDAERSSGYPLAAFSTQLAPQLPGPHLELLVATLEILSLLAAHAEANGISGSKLSKFFGLWLLTIKRAESTDDWFAFYARWERMGRILEHLFLSRIRDEAVSSRMPTRLLELVHQYPHTKASTSSAEADLLPRPRFSTRQYDALFVRIETEISGNGDEPRPHPLRLLSEAFNTEASSDANSDYVELWGSIKKAVADQTNPSPGGYPALSHIFADETIRFLSLLPMGESNEEPLLPPFNLLIPKKPIANGKRSVSDPVASPSSPTTTSRHAKPATDPVPLPSAITPSLSARSTDWTEFSASGFFENNTARTPLAATLIATEEATAPASLAATNRRSRLRPVTPLSINTNGRKSLDGTPSAVKNPQAEKLVSRATLLSLIQLDEAFIDFWADALPDPITADWPAFVICKLKEGVNGLDLTVDDGKRITWLVVEQAFKRPVVAPVETNGSTAAGDMGGNRRLRPASPKASVRSETTLHSMKKRLSFWSTSGRPSVDKGATEKGKGKQTGAQMVGELGEMLREEDENKGTVKLGIPFLKAKSRTSAEAKRKTIDFTGKSVEVPTVNENYNTNGNGVPGVRVSGLTAGAAAVMGTAAVENVATTTKPAAPRPSNNAGAAVPPMPTPKVVLPPHNALEAESVPNHKPVPGHAENVKPPKVVIDLVPESAPVPAQAAEPVSTVIAPCPVVEEVVPAVAVDSEETKPAVPVEEPTLASETSVLEVVSVPDVAEDGTASADAAPAEITYETAQEPAAEFESEPAVEEHVPEDQGQIDAPAITLDASPDSQAEESEADVTINVETVEPVPFSETSSVATPAPTYAQPTITADDAEPAGTSSHTEPLRVDENGAEDQGVVQDAVPIVDVEPTPVDSTVDPATSNLLVEEATATPTEAGESYPESTAESTGSEELPPAPESVVLSGETPGPAVALSTSERVTIAQVAAVEDDIDTQPASPKLNGTVTATDSPLPTVESVAGSTPEPESAVGSSSSALKAADGSSQDNVPINRELDVQPEADDLDDSPA